MEKHITTYILRCWWWLFLKYCSPILKTAVRWAFTNNTSGWASTLLTNYSASKGKHVRATEMQLEILRPFKCSYRSKGRLIHVSFLAWSGVGVSWNFHCFYSFSFVWEVLIIVLSGDREERSLDCDSWAFDLSKISLIKNDDIPRNAAY